MDFSLVVLIGISDGKPLHTAIDYICVRMYTSLAIKRTRLVYFHRKNKLEIRFKWENRGVLEAVHQLLFTAPSVLPRSLYLLTVCVRCGVGG